MASSASPAGQQQANSPSIAASAPRKVGQNIIDLLEIVAETELRNTYAKDLIGAEIARDLFDQDWRLARVFAMSGEFGDLQKKSEEQAIATAMAKIRLGRSWGLDESDSMRYLYFTNGKPALESAIIASKMREAGYNWDVQWHEADSVSKESKLPVKKCVGCTLWLKRWDPTRSIFAPLMDRDHKPVFVSFTKDDADAAMIWEKGNQIPLSQKWNFVSWPRDMYYSRCITRVHKYHCPEVLRGARSKEETEDVAAATEDTPEQVAERRITELRAAKGCAPGETEAERNARIDRQIEEQDAKARQASAGQQAAPFHASEEDRPQAPAGPKVPEEKPAGAERVTEARKLQFGKAK